MTTPSGRSEVTKLEPVGLAAGTSGPIPRPFDQDESPLPDAYALAVRPPTSAVGPGTMPGDQERRRRLSKITRKLHLGLRARTTFALALLSLLISVVVSSLTYFVARTSFVKERRINIERLAFANAEVASREMIDNQQNMNLVLERIDAESGRSEEHTSELQSPC